MSAIPSVPTCETETFLTPRECHETHETDDPAAHRLSAHPDLLRRAYLPGARPVLARARGGGRVHGHAGLPVQHHGISQDALGFLPRLQPAVQRRPARPRAAAVAAWRNCEERPGQASAADRNAVRRLSRIHHPVWPLL